MPITLIAAVLALLIGVNLGMLGAGGAVITIPVLVYILGMAPKQAIVLSLGVVASTAFIGFLAHRRKGNFSLRIAITFGAFAMVGAFAGAQIAKFVSEDVQMTLFAVAVLTAAISMIRSSYNSNDELQVTPSGSLDARTIAVLGIQGFGIGILTGVIGVGGGFLITPALVIIAKLPMRVAVGTSLLIITMNSLAGFAGYISYTQLDWTLLLTLSVMAAVGALIGARLSQRVPQAMLKRIFALLLIFIGIYVLYKH